MSRRHVLSRFSLPIHLFLFLARRRCFPFQQALDEFLGDGRFPVAVADGAAHGVSLAVDQVVGRRPLVAEISAHDSGFWVEQMGKGQLVLLDIRADDRRPLPVDGDGDDREPFVLILSVQRLQTGALPQAKRSPSRPDVEQDHLPPETRHAHEVSVEILQLKIADWTPVEGLDAEFRHERLGI